MKDHGDAERERSEIESDRLDNERQITDTGNGVDGNISADDEGSGDENSVDRASAPNEVPHLAIDSGLNGDEIKPSVTQLQSTAKTSELVDNIESAERSEAGNDALQPVTSDDGGKTVYSEEIGTSGEVGDNMLDHNEAYKTAVADTHEDEVEISGIEQSTATPDRRQAEIDENEGSAASAPDGSEMHNGHSETTALNQEDTSTKHVTEPNDLSHQIQDGKNNVEDAGSNNHSARNTETSPGY
ncbi:hypothetical protein MTO96_004798 [Rhipicephalus appendiculatus]